MFATKLLYWVIISEKIKIKSAVAESIIGNYTNKI